MAQAETRLTDKDLTMAGADYIQMQDKEKERISKMRIKAAHQRRWKLHYSRELKRQNERTFWQNGRQISDRCGAWEVQKNLETVWSLLSHKCTLESRVNSRRKSREDMGLRQMERQVLKQKTAQEQIKAYAEKMELSKYTKLALLNAIMKHNNDQQSHRLANIARGGGATATAVQEALRSVGINLSDGQGEDHWGDLESGMEDHPVFVCQLREASGISGEG